MLRYGPRNVNIKVDVSFKRDQEKEATRWKKKRDKDLLHTKSDAHDFVRFESHLSGLCHRNTMN